MFGFFHPRPVRDARAVAELSLRARQAQALPVELLVAPKDSARPLPTDLAPSGTPNLKAAARTDDETIHLAVRYGFGEWRAFVAAHLHTRLSERATRQGRPAANAGRATMVMLWPVLAVGVCAQAPQHAGVPLCH